MNKKKKRIVYPLMLASMLLVFGCEGEPPLVTPPEELISNMATPAEPLTNLQALAVAAACYPNSLTLLFDRPADIDGEECYVFSAYRDEVEVSQAAVSRAGGKLWFRDWQSGEECWLSGEDLDLSKPPRAMETAEQEKTLDYASHVEEHGGTLEFVNLDTIPEFSLENLGTASWNAAQERLSVQVMIVTGTANEQAAGPSIHFTVLWRDDEPLLEEAGFEAAPKYAHPAQALESGRLVRVEVNRLLEIAEYFRSIIAKMETAQEV